MLFAAAIVASGVLFAPLPKQAFNSVVAIGCTMPDGSRAWIGSGFLYAYLQRPDLKGEGRYRGYIVTNRHVLGSLKEVFILGFPIGVMTDQLLRQCSGTAAVDLCLIGVVKGYLPYSDVALSRQTGRPRVTFEENSGLAVVIPVDEIDRAIAGR